MENWEAISFISIYMLVVVNTSWLVGGEFEGWMTDGCPPLWSSGRIVVGGGTTLQHSHKFYNRDIGFYQDGGI